MAFPISPTNGDIYKDYKYNSTTTAWETNPPQTGIGRVLPRYRRSFSKTIHITCIR